MKLSIGPVGGAREEGALRFGIVWPDVVEPFRASLLILGLAGWAAIGPLIEPLMPVLMSPAAPDSSSAPAVLSLECVLLTGDQDRRLPNARLLKFDPESELFGFAMTDLQNRFAFSRDTATLTNRCPRECSVRTQVAFVGSNCESYTRWI
jgi:hypothetical protein